MWAALIASTPNRIDFDSLPQRSGDLIRKLQRGLLPLGTFGMLRRENRGRGAEALAPIGPAAMWSARNTLS
jgi:hypothetical protein